MTKEMQAILIEAIDLKIASVNRAKKGANAKFATLYDEEIATLHAATAWVKQQKIA